MRNLVVVLVGLLGAFILGVGLFNFVIMPRLVQHNVTVSVPRLVGMDLTEATERCEKAGLKILVEDRRYSEGVPNDRVLDQSPAPSTAVKPGRTIRLILSRGAELIDVPDIRGLTLRQARLRLENSNLALGRITRIYAGESGQIVRATRPRSGASTAAGNAVDLLVAVGENAQPYLMPNLQGRALEEVRELILARGFRVGRVTYRSRKGVYPGTILEHYPPSGSLIVRGESIELVAATPD